MSTHRELEARLFSQHPSVQLAGCQAFKKSILQKRELFGSIWGICEQQMPPLVAHEMLHLLQLAVKNGLITADLLIGELTSRFQKLKDSFCLEAIANTLVFSQTQTSHPFNFMLSKYPRLFSLMLKVIQEQVERDPVYFHLYTSHFRFILNHPSLVDRSYYAHQLLCWFLLSVKSKILSNNILVELMEPSLFPPRLVDANQGLILDIFKEMDLTIEQVDEMIHLTLHRLLTIWLVDQKIDIQALALVEKWSGCSEMVHVYTVLVCLIILLENVDSKMDRRLIDLISQRVELVGSGLAGRLANLALFPTLRIMMVTENSNNPDFYKAREKAFKWIEKCFQVTTNPPKPSSTEIPKVFPESRKWLLSTDYQCLVEMAHSLIRSSYFPVGLVPIPQLWLIFTASGLLSNEWETVKVAYDEFKTHFSLTRQGDGLKLISLFSFILKRSTNEKVILLIVRHALPLLALMNDPFITSACVRLCQLFLEPQPVVNRIESHAFETLLQLWQVQPRLWPQVKTYLGSWASRYKFSRRGSVDKREWDWQREIEHELLITRTIKRLCEEKAFDTSQGLLPVIVNLWALDFLQDESKINLISAFNACIKSGITTPKSGHF